MEKNRGVIRELLKFEYELGHSAKEAVKNINRAKGNGTVSYTNAKVWFFKFRNNEIDISDKKGLGGLKKSIESLSSTPLKPIRHQKGLSGKESDTLRVVGQAWDHILGASGAREDR